MDIVIASRIYLPEPSAASFYLSTVADELARRGHNVQVVTSAPPRGMTVPERRETIRTFPVLRDASGYVRGYLQYLSFDVPMAFRLLLRKKPDVVLVEPPPTTGAVVRAICGLRRIPYVYDAADLWSVAASHATSSRLVLRVLRALERWAISGATRVVTISDSVIDQIRDWGVKTQTVVVGRGADTEQFGYSPATLRQEFVYAGSYSPWHGALVLIDAFADLLTTHPEYRLRFIGHGTEHDRLSARASELNIRDAIDFAAPVPPGELAQELAGATSSLATLLPGGGYEFAFATKTYSSLASGCPVIFAGPGPTRSFLSEHSEALGLGVGVDYDAVAIAQAMRDAADAPIPPARRETIASWAETNVSMRAAAKRTADVLEELND